MTNIPSISAASLSDPKVLKAAGIAYLAGFAVSAIALTAYGLSGGVRPPAPRPAAAIQAPAPAPAPDPCAKPGAPGCGPSAAERLEAETARTLEEGRALLAAGQPERAHNAFRSLFERYPREARALAGASAASLMLGQRDGAIAEATRALAVDQRNAQALAVRARARMALGLYDQAGPDAQLAVEAAGASGEALRLRGEWRYHTGDFAGANLDLTGALAAAPADAAALALRARARAHLNDAPGAMADANAAAGTADGLAIRAYLLERAGDGAGAKRDFQAILQARPGDATALVGLCAIGSTDRDPLAPQFCEGALQADPASAAARNGRGLVRLASGDAAGALADFDAAIAARSDLAMAGYGRARALLLLGREPEARELAARARAADPEAAALVDARLTPPAAAPPRSEASPLQR